MINKKSLILGLFLLALLPLVSSAVIERERHLNLQFTDDSGNPLTGYALFNFTLSEYTDCSLPIYSNFTNLTSDTNGIISYYLQSVPSPINNTQRYLCIYRNHVLESNFSIAPSDYAIYSLNISADGILDDSNINLPTHNITANRINGFFNWTIGTSSAIYITFDGATLNFNETRLNQTISDLGVLVGFNSTFNSTYTQFAYNQTSPVFAQSLLNNTIADYGNRIGFNSTFNSTYSQFAYNQTIMSNIFNQNLNTTSNATFNNLTIAQEITIAGIKVKEWLYNQTTSVFTMLLLNNTISNWGNRIGFNSTFNSTYDQFAYNQSDGSFNSTYSQFAYNQTIMSNIFNQDLNTTNNVQFRNVTANNISASDRLRARTLDTSDNVGGVALPIQTFSIQNIAVSIFGVTLLRMTGGSGILGVGAIANGLYLIGDTGINPQLVLADTPFTHNWLINSNLITKTLEIRAEDGVASTARPDYGIDIQNNITLRNVTAQRYFGDASGLTGNVTFYNITSNGNLHIQNSTIRGTYQDWVVSNGIFNATNVNITSNHQTYNITSTTALDTTYTNNNERAMILDVTFQSNILAYGDTAYVTLYVNGYYYTAEGFLNVIVTDGNTIDEYHHFSGTIQPKQTWSLNSSVGGSGGITLDRVWTTII